MSNKISELTIYDPDLSGYINKKKHPFIYKKRQDQCFYSSFKKSDKTYYFYDGDGDNIFS